MKEGNKVAENEEGRLPSSQLFASERQTESEAVMPGARYHGEIKFILVTRDTEAAARDDMKMAEGIMRQYASHLLGGVISRPVPGGAACNERTP